MDVYIKAFKSTLELFDELVSCDLLTKRNALQVRNKSNIRKSF